MREAQPEGRSRREAGASISEAGSQTWGALRGAGACRGSPSGKSCDYAWFNRREVEKLRSLLAFCVALTRAYGALKSFASAAGWPESLARRRVDREQIGRRQWEVACQTVLWENTV